MTTFKIASIPGDGIGTEITEAAEKVLTKLASVVGTFTVRPPNRKTHMPMTKALAVRVHYLRLVIKSLPRAWLVHARRWHATARKARRYIVKHHRHLQLASIDQSLSFGAVGWPNVPDHISLWSLILPIRKYNNQYVNVRPTRILPGTLAPLAQCQKKPEDLDWVIIRENSEGEYAGQGEFC